MDLHGHKEKIIEIKKLTKTYKSRTREVVALENISLNISDGEFVAVVRPSGCGKSRFLGCPAASVKVLSRCL